MIYIILLLILLLGSLLYGLILITVGAILLLKANTQIAGILVLTAGLAITMLPLVA